MLSFNSSVQNSRFKIKDFIHVCNQLNGIETYNIFTYYILYNKNECTQYKIWKYHKYNIRGEIIYLYYVI